jgi:hypothetical protein
LRRKKVKVKILLPVDHIINEPDRYDHGKGINKSPQEKYSVKS